MIRESSFKCPRCGGSSFGTNMNTNTGHCHGDDAGDGKEGCTFTWNRSEDRRYFHYTGRVMPNTVVGHKV